MRKNSSTKANIIIWKLVRLLVCYLCYNVGNKTDIVRRKLIEIIKLMVVPVIIRKMYINSNNSNNTVTINTIIKIQRVITSSSLKRMDITIRRQ